VALYITRRQSFILGLGLLGTFFLVSGGIVYSRNKSRVLASSLNRATIEGVATPIPQVVQPQGTPASNTSGFVLNEFHRSFVKDGKMIWEVFGKRGQYAPGSNVATIEEPVLTYRDQQRGDIRVASKLAELTITLTDITKAVLSEKVVITGKDGATLKTNRAIYDRVTNTVDIPAPFELDHPAFRLLGATLQAKVEAQELKVTGGVHTTLKPKAGRKK
jgi:LPS export ABC transporter protein LptC